MATYEHESYWPEIKILAESGKYSDIEKLILKVSDPKEQIALFRFAVRGLMFRDWANKNIVSIIPLGDKAIVLALEIGETDEANIICYNMSSNLAGCWNDGMKRTKEDFQKGLQYAERALDFRRQLKKGPIPFSIAYWAKGIHLLFLSRFSEAMESFDLCLQSANEAAVLKNQPTDIESADFFSLIAHGYLSIADMALGNPLAKKTYAKVISRFEKMKEISAEAMNDAEVGISQLQNTISMLKISV